MSRGDEDQEDFIIAIAKRFNSFKFSGDEIMVPIRFILGVRRYREVYQVFSRSLRHH